MRSKCYVDFCHTFRATNIPHDPLFTGQLYLLNSIYRAHGALEGLHQINKTQVEEEKQLTLSKIIASICITYQFV